MRKNQVKNYWRRRRSKQRKCFRESGKGTESRKRISYSRKKEKGASAKR